VTTKERKEQYASDKAEMEFPGSAFRSDDKGFAKAQSIREGEWASARKA
jgi:hypothetical protein